MSTHRGGILEAELERIMDPDLTIYDADCDISDDDLDLLLEDR